MMSKQVETVSAVSGGLSTADEKSKLVHGEDFDYPTQFALLSNHRKEPNERTQLGERAPRPSE
ncbi:hypothetical protein [Microbacterium candidum]|uniref:Uncharacterized protein n=1 Tax=Microbacterium candidum TaxID=3041922 RepID=A0ABT7MW35_9MICO|nr:hypothetical protein [Microbacterium sp. ASV49]MDL9978630.1 hypothetical protein [Microbacterium sp. ASV49]